MRFKKSALALCITCSLMSAQALSNTTSTSETVTSFNQERSTNKQLTIYLKQDGALAGQVQGKTNYKTEAKRIQDSQDRLFQELLKLDPQAKLINRSNLLLNYITVETSSKQAVNFNSLENVARVQANVSVQINNANRGSIASVTTSADDTTVEVSPLLPYLGDETAGKGIDVAIISTGIDYTLAAFGGSGVYGEDNDPDTPPEAGSYLEALENGAIEFSGFPTSVVVGGWDFSSENYGNDANPIDQNLNYTSWNGWEYPTGTGTELASIVHQLAPGANLHAYKISNVAPSSWNPDNITASGPTLAKLIQAIEHALDPNQDGDTSDHLDIALIDAGGAAAFFSIDANAGPTLSQLIIERASAQGLTIVTHAGDMADQSWYGEAEAKSRSWISHEGSATSAITVGSVVNAEADGTLTSPEWAPLGPVRGSKALKPELVSLADPQAVFLISNADSAAEKMGERSGALVAAARIAAAAAVVKSTHSQLGSVEIKALLANTANNTNIFDDTGAQSELIAVGHGVENVDAAVSTPIVVWETSSSQPYIQFGVHEVEQSKRIVKEITIRNLSDMAQTYNLEYQTLGGMKEGYDALMIETPQTVSIPANSSVVVTINITVDGSKLPAWPLMQTDDYTDANLKATELNGYITLSAENKPTLNVGWMIKARNKTTITKRPIAQEFPTYMGSDPDTWQTIWAQLSWAENFYSEDENGNQGYYGLVSSFVNESLTPTTFEAFPLLIKKTHQDIGKEDLTGHQFKNVGGGIFDEAACTVTGKKLSVAVTFFKPADTSTANNFDSVGERLFFYDLFHESIVTDNGWDKSFSDGTIWDDSQKINQPFVSTNEYGQPTTYVIDYNLSYDYNAPGSRFKESSLPTKFSSDGTNVVSEVCLEDLFHHEIDSVEDFDQNIGFHIKSDRDTGTKMYQPIVQFNPILGGYFSSIETCRFDEWTGTEVCSLTKDDRTVHAGFAAALEGEEVVNDVQFSRTYTAQPGEEVQIAAISGPASFGFGEVKPAPSFMVVSLNDNFNQYGSVSFLDDDGASLAEVKAGQQFMVAENAEIGTIVGKVELDTQGFFAYPGTEWSSMDLHLVSTVEGAPFTFNSETHEITVADNSSLNYEGTKEYELKFVMQQSNAIGKTTSVTIQVSNVNDISPTVSADVAASIALTSLTLSNNDNAGFTINLDGLFSDAEGDGLTYTVAGSSALSKLAISGNVLSGKVSEAGSYSITVTASDGVNATSHELMVDVAEKPKSSGGSTGFIILMLSGLAGLFRRKFN